MSGGSLLIFQGSVIVKCTPCRIVMTFLSDIIQISCRKFCTLTIVFTACFGIRSIRPLADPVPLIFEVTFFKVMDVVGGARSMQRGMLSLMART